MADIGLFLQQGWRNLWKQPGILFFAAMVSFGLLAVQLGGILFFHFNHSAPLLGIGIYLGGMLVWVYGTIAGEAGKTFTAYSVANGERVSILSAWEVVKRVWRKVFQLYCVYIALFVPFLCLLVLFGFGERPLTASMQQIGTLLGIALQALGALFGFWFAGVVVDGMGIRASFRNAWDTFFRHFWPLAFTGLIMQAAWHLLNIGISAITLFLKSGFDAAALQTIDFLAPATSLTGYVPYRLVWTVVWALYGAVLSAVFMVAYVKYSQPKAAVAGR